MPNKDDIYRVWAPAEGLWSPWVKPVLFAFADAKIQFPPERAVSVKSSWVPPVGSTAIVLELPEEEGVLWSVRLAEMGYRPVPLYNALPFSLADKLEAPTSRPTATVHVEPILAALVRQTDTLGKIDLPSNAPPAFLLDSTRRLARTDLKPGVFDNRSVCVTTDFPSGEFLLNHGIRAAVIIQENADFAPDLRESLLLWQASGIQILLKRCYEAESPIPVVVRQPMLLKRIWYRLAIALGMPKRELGGFGGIVPASSG